MNFGKTLLKSAAIFLLLVSAIPLLCGAGSLHFVVGAPMPTSIGSPTANDGTSLGTRSIILHTLSLTNTGGSDYTFSVHDCQSTPYQLYKDSSTITAGSTIVANYGSGVLMVGCLKWVTSNVAVHGTLTAEY